jgi:ankyrin repeat protein
MHKIFVIVFCAAFFSFPAYGKSKNDSAEVFVKAAIRGDVVQIQSMLKQGVNVNATHPITKWTALIAASYYGQKKITSLLIESGADVNAKDKSGGTALIKAVMPGPYQNLQEHLKDKAEIVRMLLKAGADPQYKDPLAGKAWEIAMINGHREIIQVFEQEGVKGIKEMHLIHAASAGDGVMVKQLLADKTDVNYIDSDGWSALSEACLAGNTEFLKMLIEAGGNVNLKHQKGWTCLMIAAHNNSEEVVRVLLESGADRNIQSDDGSTAAMIAAKRGNLAIAELLK